MFDYDSLLLKLVDGKTENINASADIASPEKEIKTPAYLPFTLSEPNVLLLDMAEFKVDDGEFMEEEEILRLDNIARNIIGLPERGGSVAQPWVVEDKPTEHTVTLRFTINSEIDCSGALLALEDAEKAKIIFNGNEIANKVIGWYTDKDIKTVALSDIVKGENILEITLPIGERTNTEWCYILGNFGVSVAGRNKRIIAMPEKIAFGSITNQGLPFYGGNITYHLEAEGSTIQVEASRYRGGIIDVKAPVVAQLSVLHGAQPFGFVLVHAHGAGDAAAGGGGSAERIGDGDGGGDGGHVLGDRGGDGDGGVVSVAGFENLAVLIDDDADGHGLNAACIGEAEGGGLAGEAGKFTCADGGGQCVGSFDIHVAGSGSGTDFVGGTTVRVNAPARSASQLMEVASASSVPAATSLPSASVMV